MVYRAFTRLLTLAARTFFKRIEVLGRNHIPEDGAVIFAGNHPNALVDGLLLMIQAKRSPIRFLGNAKLWRVPLLGRMLDAVEAVPVYRPEEHGPNVDNQDAFERVYDVLASGACLAVFPEGISHTESQLSPLKTGTARIALHAAARRNVAVTIVPFGLTYVNRHRFRSQALLHFGEPIAMNEHWLTDYDNDEKDTVRRLTGEVRNALVQLTLNAPDWDTLRFVHAARRLYKPPGAELTPGNYVELSRRFVEHYAKFGNEPEIRRLRREVEDYQAQLNRLGLKDYQLSHPTDALTAIRRMAWRAVLVTLLLPLALPGATILLPIAWFAATAGSLFSYDLDDVATLKVVTGVVLMLLVCLGLTIAVGITLGLGWGLFTMLLLPASLFATLLVLERQVRLLSSTLGLFRLVWLREEVRNLSVRREKLVAAIRTAVDHYADPSITRIFEA